MRIYSAKDLPKLPWNKLAEYNVAIADEQIRLWDEFERTPCKENLDAWRDFWNDVIDPALAEELRRDLAQLAVIRGPGGVQV